MLGLSLLLCGAGWAGSRTQGVSVCRAGVMMGRSQSGSPAPFCAQQVSASLPEMFQHRTGGQRWRWAARPERRRAQARTSGRDRCHRSGEQSWVLTARVIRLWQPSEWSRCSGSDGATKRCPGRLFLLRHLHSGSCMEEGNKCCSVAASVNISFRLILHPECTLKQMPPSEHRTQGTVFFSF